VATREFNFLTSVFKNWIRETPLKHKESIESDTILWKLKKFVKDQDDVSLKLKLIFGVRLIYAKL
jgi:hypothetical protein